MKFMNFRSPAKAGVQSPLAVPLGPGLRRGATWGVAA
ncbi:MAG: hypothetical protein QOJ53_2409 [Sphingomonadales bacterium]|jgi:hypothetical protein|nr:hypothetical protein [Sphingomonadales bacterium]MEA3048077.1 hypothetical protein [Sphingomonadales bacterium]